MTRLHLDFETYSECDLKACGAFKYAEHPSTEILVACFAFDDEEVQTWVPEIDGPVPQRLREHIEAGNTVCAHNYQFERVIANGVAGKKVGFPALTIEQGCCTAVKARAHGLPGALSDVAKALGTHLKNDAGRGVMMQLVKPKKATKKDPATRYTRENAPDKFAMLLTYCQDDVRAERGVDRALPDLTPNERKVWELDARINEKGVLVDLARIEDIRFLIGEYRKELREECMSLTWSLEEGGIEPTQRGKIAEWIRLNGWPSLEDMQAETVKGLLENPKVPKLVKRVLAIYSTYGMKAVAKFDVMVEAACADGRVKGMFIMNGAGPGRWSSVLIQLQNMARGHIDDPLVAIEACKMRDLAWIKALYPKINPMKVFASCVRGMLVAPPGKKLVSFDFAGIESRKGAWLADEHWKLAAFRAMDAGTGPDLYELAYSRAFRVPIKSVDKKKRQVGKVCLAGDTLVLCERGWARIDHVLLDDKVWDGDKWTDHGGLIYNGLKKTVQLCGVSLTPDHRVWCAGTWKPAAYLVASEENTSQALVSAAENLPSQATCVLSAKACGALSSDAIVTRENTWWSQATSNENCPPGATPARKSPPVENGIGNTQQPCPTMSSDAACSTGLLPRSADATTLTNVSTGITVVEESRSATCGDSANPPSLSMCKPSKDGTIPPSKWIEQTTTEITKKATFGSSRRKPTSVIDELSEHSARKMHVYDLLSVGSKNRFVILSSRGPLLVHNCELALGYEGGVGAFVTMTKTYGVKLDELTEAVWPGIPGKIKEQAEWLLAKQGSKGLSDKTFIAIDSLKRLWRLNHPAQVQLWKDLKEAMIFAMKTPGSVFAIPNKKIKLCVQTVGAHTWLYMKLPSGRKIAYFDPRLEIPKVKCRECKGCGDNRWDHDPVVRECAACEGSGLVDGEPVPTYMGIDTDTRRWMRVSTYGGKILENGDQGSCACLLRDAMLRLDAEFYDTLILTAHDEVVLEVDEGADIFDRVHELMVVVPEYVKGLPIAAEGWAEREYRK